MKILNQRNLLQLNLRLVVPFNLLTREILDKKDNVIKSVIQSTAKE